MDEAELWVHLEYRLCDELALLRLPDAPGLWCDGLIPEQRSFETDPATITGRAWMGGLPGQHPTRDEEEWRFLLRIHGIGAAGGPPPWADLLPGEASRGWLHVSVENRELTMDLRSVHSGPARG